MWEYSLKEKERLIREFGPFGRRSAFARIKSLINPGCPDRIVALYGLRRTGKSVMMAQLIAEMDKETQEKCVYIDCEEGDSFIDLCLLLKKRRDEGAMMAFVDEITKSAGFLEKSATLHDVFTRLGFPLVMSGTDSLFFKIAEDRELLDRVEMIRTTHISWPEHARLLGTQDIGEYIEKGGILSGRFDNYPLSAIAGNIQNSLAHWKKGSSLLRGLAQQNELANAVQRIVENQNHEIVLETLQKSFASRDLGSLLEILTKREETFESAALIEKMQSDINSLLKDTLEIRERNELSVPLDQEQIIELREWLVKLDLFLPRIIRSSNSVKNEPKTDGIPDRQKYPTLCAQVGLRWNQAKTLIDILKKKTGPDGDRHPEIFRKLESDIKGQLLEELIITDVIRNLNGDEDENKGIFSVFTLKFEGELGEGEVDMVIKDERDGKCRLYEIKHSSAISDWQAKHMRNHAKMGWLERHVGRIASRAVLYQGRSAMSQGNVGYLNITEFLEKLPEFAKSLLSGFPLSEKDSQAWLPDQKLIRQTLETVSGKITAAFPCMAILPCVKDGVVLSAPISAQLAESLGRMFEGSLFCVDILNFHEEKRLFTEIDALRDKQNDLTEKKNLDTFRNNLSQTLEKVSAPKNREKVLREIRTEFERMFKFSEIAEENNPKFNMEIFITNERECIFLNLGFNIDGEEFKTADAKKVGKIMKYRGSSFRIPELPEDWESSFSSLGWTCENESDFGALCEAFLEKTFPQAETVRFYRRNQKQQVSISSLQNASRAVRRKRIGPKFC